ncbi:MAG: hypothetical protein D4R81_01205 [Nitrospiraceae bacterium]|nr:MAG: hypothetical protein D4R81_01205 [Nitrospiraceae bacterium]
MTTRHQHLIRICREAVAGGWAVQSTGEKLLTALILNRGDWLSEMGYTMADAIDRVGLDWIALIPDVAKILREEGQILDTIPTLRSSATTQ